MRRALDDRRHHENKPSAIERGFRALLKLYPGEFQAEFRDEMLDVAMAC